MVFRSRRRGGEDLWLSDAAGSTPRRLTELRAESLSDLAFSPDGRRVAFAWHSSTGSDLDGSDLDGTDLYVIDVEDRFLRRFTRDTEGEQAVAFTADGRGLLFSSNRDGRWNVWRVDAAGRPPRRMTTEGGFAPRASPDGRWLTFTRHEGGLWRMPADGGNAELIPGTKAVDWRAWLGRARIGEEIYAVARRGDGLELLRLDPERGELETMTSLGAHRATAIALSPRLDFLLLTRSSVVEGDLRLLERGKPGAPSRPSTGVGERP